MKKYLLIFLAVIMAMSLLTTTAFATDGPFFSVSDVTAEPGETDEILVSIPDYINADTVGLTYQLPEGVTLVAAEWLVEGDMADTESEPNAAAWAKGDGDLLHGHVFKLTVKIEEAAQDDVALDLPVYLVVKNAGDEVFAETVTARVVSHVTHNTRKTPVAPTCTVDGYQSVVCTICGEDWKEDDPALKASGHQFGDWQIDKENAPTCTKAGKEIRYCSCSEFETRDAAALDHLFVDYKSDNNATCTKDGTKTAICDRDGCDEKDVVTDTGSKKDHADGNKDHKCDTCQTAMGKHEAASGKHTCGYCGKTVTTCADGNKDHKCDVCGKEISKCADANGDYKCDVCGKEMEKPEPEAPKVEGVTRLAGKDRLITSYLVADQLKEKLGVEKFDAVIVASGSTFADALPGSYLSAVKNAPILLTLAKDKYIQQTADYIKANLKEGGTVYILGGESAVPKTMEAALPGLKTQRVAGKDRFGTNLEILKVAGVKTGDEILVCEGKGYADSLSASATGKPILLVYKKVTDEQKAYLKTLSGNTFCVVGGTTAVPDSIAKEMENYGTVSRLAGKDRLETSTMVAEKYFKGAAAAVVAYGWDFPDGLCGGSLAYATKSPLILTHSKEKLYQFTADYTVKAGLKEGYVLGGDGLVSDEATRAIFAMGSEPITILK